MPELIAQRTARGQHMVVYMYMPTCWCHGTLNAKTRSVNVFTELIIHKSIVRILWYKENSFKNTIIRFLKKLCSKYKRSPEPPILIECCLTGQRGILSTVRVKVRCLIFA